MAAFTTVQRGAKYTDDYRVFYKNSETGDFVSPMNDIPCWANEGEGIVNMVCEVGRWTNAKMEISTKDELNPIKQDTKKGKLRFVHNCFPHHGYIWNYGAVPQTFEDPDSKSEHTGFPGDGDPLDVCDISSRVAEVGEIRQVKILGVLAMIDEDETDWKLFGIDVNDPKAAEINDISDVDKVFPGLLVASHEWFRIYKIPAGKPENKFAFDGECKDRKFAIDIIKECQKQWSDLFTKETKISTVNTTLDNDRKVSQDAAKAIVDKFPEAAPDAAVDPVNQHWHYVRL